MADGYLCLILHAHLPFVRHPEQDVFLEENWLYEAITETYIPLLQVIRRWAAEGIRAPITFTLTPTLCCMLADSLLQQRYSSYLDRLLELCDREIHRTNWEPQYNALARYYFDRIQRVAGFYASCNRDLLRVFKELQ